MSDAAPFCLASTIAVDNILVNPEKEDRTSVIRALLRSLVDSGKLTKSQANTANKALAEREALGSTAIGQGVALPHARVAFCDEVIAAFALLKQGADFSALDGAPVRLVFLLITPKSSDQKHIEAMKKVTGFVKVDIHVKALAGCKTGAEVKGVFADYAGA